MNFKAIVDLFARRASMDGFIESTWLCLSCTSADSGCKLGDIELVDVEWQSLALV